MINVNKLDKKLSTKTFNVWVYKNKSKKLKPLTEKDKEIIWRSLSWE